MITQELLREKFDYNPETGVFTRKSTNHRGSEFTGTVMSQGYVRIRLLGKNYYLHRLIWLWYYGVEPTGKIMFIDGNPDNTSIANLSDVSKKDILANRARLKGRHVGVSFHKQQKFKPWYARIIINDVVINLGYFHTENEAIRAYLAAKDKYCQTVIRPDDFGEGFNAI